MPPGLGQPPRTPQPARPRTATPTMAMGRRSSGNGQDLLAELAEADATAPPRDITDMKPRVTTPRLKAHVQPFLFTKAAKQNLAVGNPAGFLRPKSAMSERVNIIRSRPGSAVPQVRARPASAMDFQWHAEQTVGTARGVKQSARDAQEDVDGSSYVRAPPPKMDPYLEREQREAKQRALLEKEFSKKEQSVHALHEQFDAMHRKRMHLQTVHQDRQDKSNELDLEESSYEALAEDRNRKVKMSMIQAKMSYWDQALLQEQLYSKTLQHMLSRVKRLLVEEDCMMKDIHKETSQHNHDLQSLLVMYLDVKAEQTALEQQLAEFKREMVHYKKETKRRLRERREERKKLHVTLRGEGGEVMGTQEGDGAGQDGDDDVNENENKAKFGFGNLVDSFGMPGFPRKGASLEDGFKTIQRITGETDLTKIINSFVHRDVKRQHFEQMLNEAKVKVERMMDEKARLDIRLDTIKFHGEDQDNERKLITKFHTDTLALQRKGDDRQVRFELMDKCVVGCKAGFDYLTEKLVRQKFEHKDRTVQATGQALVEKSLGGPEVADQTYAGVLKKFVVTENKLEALYNYVKEHKHLLPPQFEQQNSLGFEQTDVNKRIDLPLQPKKGRQWMAVTEEGRVIWGGTDSPTQQEYDDGDDSANELDTSPLVDRATIKVRSDRSYLRQRKIADRLAGVSHKRVRRTRVRASGNDGHAES